MVGVGIILVIVGIVLGFLVPWAGVPIGLVGLALVALWLAGFGRRAVRGRQPH